MKKNVTILNLFRKTIVFNKKGVIFAPEKI